MYFLLHYDYVSDILEQREPHRAGHLGLLKDFEDKGELLLAGPVGNPVTGAVFAFKVESEAQIQAFVDQDPYVSNGLVTGSRIEPWTVVIGSAFQPD